MMSILRRARLPLLGGLFLASAACWTADSAVAADRRLVFIVEKPVKNAEQQPNDQQMVQASEIQRLLSERFQALLIDDHMPVDGRGAAAKTFDEADQVVQVILDVSSLGYEIKAHIFDRTEPTEWHEILQKALNHGELEALEEKIARELVPQVLVWAVELTHGQRRVLLADCLFPGRNQERLFAVGQRLTEPYARRLRNHEGLQRTFAVVRLVSTIQPPVYRWWCVDLRRPRSGLFRRDQTVTISGVIEIEEAAGPDRPEKMTMSLEMLRSGRPYPSDPIDIDLGDRDGTMRRIMETVERLTQ